MATTDSDIKSVLGLELGAVLQELVRNRSADDANISGYTNRTHLLSNGLSLRFQAAAAGIEENGGSQAREKPPPCKGSDTHDFFKNTFHHEGPSNRKRNRTVAKLENEDQAALLKDIFGKDDEGEEKEDEEAKENGVLELPITTAVARAIGVHSAVALFRRPTSKKYTRPAMSMIFTSLDLNPEQFLHLQAAAKTYMLDRHHPERVDYVGNKGKGSTDITIKFKLFACVKTFLEAEGWGEKYFGVEAPDAKSRKLKWPQMKDEIISRVTPLVRRMVTNERQRKYGLESREGKREEKRKKDWRKGSSCGGLDPKLGEYRCTIKSTYPRKDGDGNGNPKEQAGVASGIQFVSRVSFKSRSLDKECANS